MVYRFIEEHKKEFGVCWLIKRFQISANSYYNYLKHRKEIKRQKEFQIKEEIKSIYYNHNKLLGHRGMQIFLQRKGIFLSKTTVFKYMNKELNLHSITRLKKSRYKKGIVHKVYENEVNQEFNVKEKNKVWCTDFTYIRLRNGKMRYNCSILDLYDRAVVASVNSKYINTETAINTLTIALKKETIKNTLILHSDQGSQFTSYEFGQFCANNKIVQSMSRAGCPYDNAVMERFYKTFKMEFIYLHSFVDDEDLDRKTNKYIHLWYNYLRPHSYNKGLSPLEKRAIV